MNLSSSKYLFPYIISILLMLLSSQWNLSRNINKAQKADKLFESDTEIFCATTRLSSYSLSPVLRVAMVSVVHNCSLIMISNLSLPRHKHSNDDFSENFTFHSRNYWKLHSTQMWSSCEPSQSADVCNVVISMHMQQRWSSERWREEKKVLWVRPDEFCFCVTTHSSSTWNE